MVEEITKLVVVVVVLGSQLQMEILGQMEAAVQIQQQRVEPAQVMVEPGHRQMEVLMQPLELHLEEAEEEEVKVIVLLKRELMGK